MARDVYSFRFVCQGGGLDVKSSVLAASLASFARCPHELVACVPQGRGCEPPRDDVLDLLRALGARLELITNPLDPGYPVGNKLGALMVPTDAAVRVFLDSDIVCTRPLYALPEQAGARLQAKLEDWNHHGPDEWRRLYDHFHMGAPRLEYRSTVLDEPMPLYFNAGVLLLDNASLLIEHWIATAREIDENLDLPRRRPNLDQLALAVAVTRFGHPWRLLGEAHNYPAELRPLDPAVPPYLCHYHDPLMILADDYLTGVVARLCRRYPGLGRIAAESSWVWQSIAATKPAPLLLP